MSQFQIEQIERALQNIECDNDLTLEPRLQEYLRKKLFYYKNRVRPDVGPEKEFQITEFDIETVKEFLNGNRNIYKHMSDERKTNTKRKKKDIHKNKESKPFEIPVNRGMFVPDDRGRYYEDAEKIMNEKRIMDARDFTIDSKKGFNLNYTRFNPRIDPEIDAGLEKHNKLTSQYRVCEPPNLPVSRQKAIAKREYPFMEQENKPQKIATEDTNSWNINREYKSYAKPINPMFNQSSDMDTDLKVVIPKISSNMKKDLNSSDYRLADLYGRKGIYDTELETCFLQGIPSHTKKSYGYRNPNDHYYDFIEYDYATEGMGVDPFIRGGFPTRMENKKVAKKRDVY